MGKGGLDHLPLPDNGPTLREARTGLKLGRDLEAEAEAEPIEEGLLTDLHLVARSSLLSCSIKGCQPRGSTVHNEQDPLILVTNQENVPQANLVWAFSQLRLSL